jgi:hypothetical protein
MLKNIQHIFVYFIFKDKEYIYIINLIKYIINKIVIQDSKSVKIKNNDKWRSNLKMMNFKEDS